MFRITFSKANVKRFQQELDKAYKRGDNRAVRRLSVLMMIGCSIALEIILSVWNVSQPTVYNWLNDFLVEQFESFKYRQALGRPPRFAAIDRVVHHSIIVEFGKEIPSHRAQQALVALHTLPPWAFLIVAKSISNCR